MTFIEKSFKIKYNTYMIVKLKPALKTALWGGQKLKQYWHKDSPQSQLSESWELSFNPDGASLIDSGIFSGKQLQSVATRLDWGHNCDKFGFFPTLIKLIDTDLELSIQVHPSDDYALKHENGQYGKTEMWYILDCLPNSTLKLGFNRTMTKDEVATNIANNTITDCLNTVPVHKGDTFFIPSGTIHSIGAGITLIEIQQNSSITYRVYDFGRLDKDGNPRQLHVKQALEVLNLNKYDVPNPTRNQLLGSCNYFSAYHYFGNKSLINPNSFTSITSLCDNLNVSGLTLNKGDTVFASANEQIVIEGNGDYILVNV